jgi:hypothetical protein
MACKPPILQLPIEAKNSNNEHETHLGLFGIAFERSKSILNIQKARLQQKKKKSFGKKIKSAFKGPKRLKIVKKIKHF